VGEDREMGGLPGAYGREARRGDGGWMTANSKHPPLAWVLSSGKDLLG